MAGARILIIEYNARMAQFIERGLIYEGYRASLAYDGQTGLTMAGDNPPDLVILGWMMPKLDGLEVCRRLRAGGNVPILMLTAKDDIRDRVAGLDAGADDYMVKPFSMDELMARIRALFRRATSASRPEVLRFGDLSLDTGTHRAYRHSRAIDLTAKEYELLALFMRHPRQVLTRKMIFDRVWEHDFGGESNIIEVYIRCLRQKNRSRQSKSPHSYCPRGWLCFAKGITAGRHAVKNHAANQSATHPRRRPSRHARACPPRAQPRLRPLPARVR